MDYILAMTQAEKHFIHSKADFDECLEGVDQDQSEDIS